MTVYVPAESRRRGSALRRSLWTETANPVESSRTLITAPGPRPRRIEDASLQNRVGLRVRRRGDGQEHQKIIGTPSPDLRGTGEPMSHRTGEPMRRLWNDTTGALLAGVCCLISKRIKRWTSALHGALADVPFADAMDGTHACASRIVN